MKASDYEAVVFDGEIYCDDTDCLPEGVERDDDGILPIFATSEWNRYPVCCHCGYKHEYVSLTEAGVIYELEFAFYDANCSSRSFQYNTTKNKKKQ